MKTGIKKLLAMALVAAMSLSLAACGGGGDDTDKPKPTPKPTPEIEVLDTGMLKQAMSDDNAMAVAYLGWCEDELDKVEDYLTAINMDNGDYSFMFEISEDYRVDAEGDELFCIVPKNDDDTVTISEWIIDEYNDWQGEEGNVLYHKKNDGNPVLLKCNESEIMPNVLITITDTEGNVNRMVPYITQMDGTLTTYLDEENPFYDFSPYAQFMPGWVDGWDNSDNYYGDDNVFDIVYLAGDWSTTVYTDDDMYLDGSFTFDGSGNLSFAYGVSGETYSIYYEGSYYMAEDSALPEDAVILELYLTEDNTDGEHPKSLYTAVTFEMSRYSDYMGMEYQTGDLLFCNEYDTYYELLYTIG
ncbi:MAG: hypothetical protein IJD80_06625 [Oscillospiraceae bacterium]|nr:hypothetical protein [Oscillospiraceae bacterium]